VRKQARINHSSVPRYGHTEFTDKRHPRSDAGSQSQETQATEFVRLPK